MYRCDVCIVASLALTWLSRYSCYKLIRVDIPVKSYLIYLGTLSSVNSESRSFEKLRDLAYLQDREKVLIKKAVLMREKLIICTTIILIETGAKAP
jgi:hypothetical protein